MSKPSNPTGSQPAGVPCTKLLLRQKAEDQFRQRESHSPENLDSLSPESMRTILHELRVHQIELELQNEELRMAEATIDASRERYFDLYDLAPVGYFTASKAGLIMEANLTAASLLGVDRGALIKQPVSRLIFKEDQDIFYKHRQQLFETGEPQQCELRVVKQDGSTFWAQFSATAARDETGAPSCRIALIDITERKRGENALAALVLRYKTLLQSGSDSIHVLDDQGNVVEANEAFCRMLGYTHDEAMRLNVADWDAQWSREELLVIIRDFIAHSYVFETRHRRKDGSHIDVEINGVGVTLDGQNYFYASARDITERKRLEAYRKLVQEVLQELNDPGDLEDSIHRILAALKKQTGVDAAGIRLQDGDDFPYFVQEGFPKNFLLTENSLFERAADGGVCRDKDGKACLECTCGLVISGRTDPSHPLFTKGGSCWTNDSSPLLDIPANEDPRHHPRNQCIHHGYSSVALVPIRTRDRILGLIQLNDRRKGCFTLERVGILESVAVHIGEALMRRQAENERNEALRRAEAANRAKGEFLGVMSHELRTPLNGVLGFAELLSYTSLDSDQKDYVRTINSRGSHLLAIVNDILDFSSIEAGTLAIEVAPLAVADLVKRAGDTVRKSAADKGIEFRREVAAGVPEQISGDERRMQQVLLNLLGNAIKFTESGSVVLRVATASDGGRRSLDFCVEDTGIGISSETLSHLFQPFAQADATTSRRFGGTGLGLAISKRIAEAMGGSITVASTPGKGSTFTFRLPLEIPTVSSGTAGAPLCDPPSTLPSDGLVLVVDDDQASSVIAGKMLRSLGYRVEFAASGDVALKAFVPGKFSAILMDIAMPVMDGFVATAKIREAEAAGKGRVPIIAFTANVLPGDRERCLAAGMDDYLSKPFTRDELAEKLASAAARKLA